MTEKAILFDSSRCSACKACQVACKCWNGLPSPMETNSQEWSGTLQNPPDLNDNTRLIITFDEADNGKAYGVNWAFGRRACMHCTDAGCVQVCPSGALFKDEETGLVSYNKDKCIGCKYCAAACPFDVPRHIGSSFLGGETLINKCTGCLDRVRQDRAPACVTTCQPGALRFGDRDEMIAIAEERVELLKSKGFDSARTYGVDEMGGCHVIHVLKYPIDQYELPEKPELSPLVEVLEFMKPLAGVGTVALLGGLGLSFLTGIGYQRHKMRYDEVNHDIIDEETGEVIRHIDVEAGER
ncbi:4Fe-4S dicluster domain-containing protein [Slackia heliotrinireducens]|uniref:4Fe-4S dicluster domain-containing protein n=1 Tax=Slackia heliotrinireducens TaxID=84110 RepID=UPI003316279E